MVVVDTTVWIDFLRGNDNLETAWLERELRRQRPGLTDLILCGVLQGVRDSDFPRVRDDLLRFAVFEICSADLAIAAAQHYRMLRRKGYTVRAPPIDCLIATFCLQAGHQLLHRDRDYDAFENGLGLGVVHA